MSKVDQQKIAAHLGLSRATVSRCFTNHPGINPLTRASVFEIAARLGYQHLQSRTPAAAPGKGVERTIGVLICTAREEYLRLDYQNPAEELLAGISEFAQVHRLRLELD